ncbi:hypothetical protein [Actinomadura miaoliensis]|uniref:Uncharacterized protein n=1 Tax=Actinomadura miaoliensis TaxID=430685 RepID=A0ABP7VIT9_9ACTN
MSTGSQDFDRAAAEHLLDGAADGPHADPLARLLASAAAPAQDSELAGEEAAVAAFRAASSASAAAPHGAAAPHRATASHRAGRGRPRLAGAFTAKIAAAVLVTVVGGGVAVAAGTGTLPLGPAGKDTSSSRRPLSSPTAPTPVPPRPGGTTNPSKGTAADPKLVEQCRDYAGLDNNDKAKALRSRRFHDLAEAAGSKGQVAGYCSRLLRPTPQGSNGASTPRSPAQSSRPPVDTRPTGRDDNNGNKKPKSTPSPGFGEKPDGVSPHRPTGRPSGSHRPGPRPDKPGWPGHGPDAP